MSAPENVTARIVSNDKNVLELCDKFVASKLAEEKERGLAAERRASVVLGVVSAAAILVTFIAQNVVSQSEDADRTVLALFFGSIAWLVRAVWYAVRTMGARTIYRVEVETILELQQMSYESVLKNIISANMWEYRMQKIPNTTRMFYAQRAQRAIVMFAILLLSVVIITAATAEFEAFSFDCLAPISLVFVLIHFVFFDQVVERLGIWRH